MRLTGLPPIIFAEPKLLILGTFPSVKSLERKQYYGNPINGFWKILSGALEESVVPENYADKNALLRKHKIALWDIFGACERRGSGDHAIKNYVVNPIPDFLKKHPTIKKVLIESRTAEKIWKQQFQKKVLIPGAYVPSPSTLARMPLTQKIRYWKKELIF